MMSRCALCNVNCMFGIKYRILLSVANSFAPMAAKIHINGVRGFVDIYPGTDNQTSTIAVVVWGLKFNNTIDIRENMALKNVEKKCLDEDLGKRWEW